MNAKQVLTQATIPVVDDEPQMPDYSEKRKVNLSLSLHRALIGKVIIFCSIIICAGC